MRKILIVIVILSIMYFILGYIAVLLNWIEKDIYLTFSAIIGGVASVSGLLAFATNRIKRQDIESVGVEYYKKVVESAEELKRKEVELLSKEDELNSKEKEIQELEIKKQEMEYLVRKASMSLFLQDQFDRSELRIAEIMQENSELSKLIEQHETIKKQLGELDIEINTNENAALLYEIIANVKMNQEQNKKIKRRPLSSFELLMEVSESLVKMIKI